MPVNVEYYQLTPVGVQRLSSGFIPSMEFGEREVLKFMGRAQGYAEVDEISVSTGLGPTFTNVALRKLADKGLIAPVSLQAPAETAQLGG